MDSKRWKRINNIVDTALELEDEERTTYIEQECGGDAELKSQVTELLESIEKSETENFLEDAADFPQKLAADLADEDSASPLDASSLTGQQIGNYRIVELIDHGGMGSVYLAERADESYEQRVALKVLRRGMNTPENIERFRRERQILAKLDHPNIAKLLDGGVTEAGLPYLVMEYVEGTPLHEYCNEECLTVDQRLELFRTICRATQHAHANAIIHRDLKPSNILVRADGTVKILDFGIAKLLEPQDTGSTLYETRPGARLLTLGYAAPEQLEGPKVTTAVDTYTLGILLYELISGLHPFDLEGKGLSEIEQIIRTELPQSPSAKFRDLDEEKQREIAQQRNTTPSRLTGELEGDLDAIALKALRKEPEERYYSAEQFISDLKKRRKNQPVLARDDTFSYKTRKFFKRHQTGLTWVAVTLLVITAVAAYYTVQLSQQRDRARQEAEKAEEVTDFLVNVISRSNPYSSQQDVGLDVTLGTLLQEGRENINKTLEEQPAVRAELKTVMGEVYSQLGEYAAAESLLTDAIHIYDKVEPSPTVEKAEAIKMLGFMHQDNGDYQKAQELLKQALAAFEQTKGLMNREAAEIIARLGNLTWFNKGEFHSADSLLNKALTIEKKINPDNHLRIANVNNDLAAMKHGRGLLVEAKSYYSEAISGYRKLTETHANLAIILGNYAAVLLDMGEYDKAEKVQREALRMHREQAGEKSIDVALGLGRLGKIALEESDYSEADSLLNLSMEKASSIFGSTHPYIARLHLDLGRLAMHKQEFQKAKELMQKARSEYQKVYPEKHPRQSDPLLRLGMLHLELGNISDAESYFAQSLDIRNASYPPESWHVAEAQAYYGRLLHRTEQYEKAERMLSKSYENAMRIRGENDSFVDEIRTRLADCYRALGKNDKAEQYR